ncbi:uncharacterized protein K452DRAFT_316711 [Aplosporella prunicola CBS 121167]|uniref:Rhodopsin domain-containing protein n=1 Tax=Aplosporella prunicola CBS 121167 TaxID=1176127 RepID=A0A6A6BQD6_9PEZI|nr:uncharacterized protein K452DRAFT_316711 [Aplosporella prunicola CBS 121167]KAF2144791.1 hypothetical protein K452DRAFT_316711 [Aplosporella prunicola CBS 121167]
MANGDPTHEEMLVEGIVFWVIALLFMVGRIWSRALTTGSIKQMASDDYVMIVTFLFYTALIVLLQFNVRYASNLMDPADLPEVLKHPDQVQSRIFGSKITLAVEQCMIHTQWGTKASILILYHRMTRGLRENTFNKILAGYMVFAYVFVQVTFFGVWCRPFNQYWALPPSNEQCAHYGHYCITMLVFNVSTDILMFCIPIPLILRAQMKPRKKALLVAVFSLGVFNIVASVLNKVYNWILPGSIVYMIWYVRESSTGIYVANATCCWPLLRRILGRASREWTDSHTPGAYPPTSGEAYYGEGKSKTRSRRSRHLAHHSTHLSAGGAGFSKLRSLGSKTVHSLHSSVSHSAFAAPPSPPSSQNKRLTSPSEEAFYCGAHTTSGGPLEVWRHVEYDINVSEEGRAPTASPPPMELRDLAGREIGGKDAATGHVAVVEVGRGQDAAVSRSSSSGSSSSGGRGGLRAFRSVRDVGKKGGRGRSRDRDGGGGRERAATAEEDEGRGGAARSGRSSPTVGWEVCQERKAADWP